MFLLNGVEIPQSRRSFPRVNSKPGELGDFPSSDVWNFLAESSNSGKLSSSSEYTLFLVLKYFEDFNFGK